MGIYSSNTISSIGNIQVEAAEGYNGSIGVQLAMIEGFQNDLALFDSTIMNDFREAGMVQEGASLDEMHVVQEGAAGGFLESIKQFFIKLWEKIKGIFNGFIAKFDSMVMKSNKAFHDKYSKEVYAKDLSKMKAKYSKPKSGFEFAFMMNANDLDANALCNKSDAEIEKVGEDFDREDYFCDILNGCKPTVNISSESEYLKDAHEACFEDEDEQDGFSSIIHEIGASLSAKKDPVEAVKKANASLEKALKDMIGQIEKSKTAVSKLLPIVKDNDNKDYDTKGVKTKFGVDTDGEGKTKPIEGQSRPGNTYGHGVKKLQKALNVIHTKATVIQSASLKFTAAALAETKFGVAQSRRIFAAAVAFNPKSVKESAVLQQAMEEAAHYEVMTNFECY